MWSLLFKFSSFLFTPLIPNSGGASSDSVGVVSQVEEKLLAAKNSGFNFKEMLGEWLTSIINFGLRVVIALVVFYLFRRAIKYLLSLFKRRLAKRNIDSGLASFLSSVLHGLAFVVLVLLLIDILGFKSVSFAALMAAVGVALGAALSGQLQNLAAGVVILATRPFKVGDWIVAKGEEGTVTEISIFYTTLLGVDNSSIHIPNAVLTSDKLKNTSSETLRRCQWVVDIEYGADVALAKKTLNELVESDNRFKKDPAPLIVVRELADSSVKVMLRAWCANNDFWTLIWEMNEKIYQEFQQKQIPFAFPSITVYQGASDCATAVSSRTPLQEERTPNETK